MKRIILVICLLFITVQSQTSYTLYTIHSKKRVVYTHKTYYIVYMCQDKAYLQSIKYNGGIKYTQHPEDAYKFNTYDQALKMIKSSNANLHFPYEIRIDRIELLGIGK